MSSNNIKLGDIWYRVEGEWIVDGSETYAGMELGWQEWEAIKLTPRGAWFKNQTHYWKKTRFALATGARWLTPTKREALVGLIARKKRHLEIIRQQTECATETLSLAREELDKLSAWGEAP